MKSVRAQTTYLDSLQIGGVVFSVVVSMIWPPLLAVALGVAAFFILIRWNPRRGIGLHSLIDGGILGLGLAALATLLISVQPETTLPQVLRLLIGIGLYFTLVQWAVTRQRVAGLVIGLVGVGVGLAFLAPFSVTWMVRKIPLISPVLYEKFSVLLADAVHPNVMAGYLLILLPLPAALLLFAWREHRPRWRVSVGLATGVMLAVLVLTQSRAAWLALGLTLGVLAMLRWCRGWIGIGSVVLLAGAGLWVSGGDWIAQWFTINSTFTSLESRGEVWQRAFYMLQDFPLGVGMGLFGKTLDSLYPLFLSAPGTIPHAHNIFLQVAVDLGLPGLLIWLGLFSSMLVFASRIYRAGRQAGHGGWAGLGAGLLCSQIALLAHGLVDAVTWGMARPAPLVWALWGTIMAGAHLVETDLTPEIGPKKWRLPRGSKIAGVVVGLALIGLIPQGIAAYRATVTWAATYRAALQPHGCESVDAAPLLALNPERRAALGSFLISNGCIDLAAQILPQFFPAIPRADLLAYQWGRIAWFQGDEQGAIRWWRQSPNVEVWLLRQARQTQTQDVRAAMDWYEAAILSAGNPRVQAEAIVAYTEDLRGKLGANEFAERCAYLADALGSETGVGQRLQGQRFLWQGNFAAALPRLTQAIATGFDDAETWYLLGETHWNLNDWKGAEQAYRAALNAAIQVPQRRPWYSYRLAALLAKGDRINEALVFQQESVRLSDYYVYWDYLAVLYARLGSIPQRQAACQRARELAGAGPPVLECEIYLNK